VLPGRIVARETDNLLKSRILAAASGALLVVAILSLAQPSAGSSFPGSILETLRWIVILLFAGYAAAKRSLTAWILVGMAAGVEFGHDWPARAVQLQVLGTIFLRLIKVIIAPLLFGTLVVGIAGHADLKKVGRMGVKALVYFEIVSTLALIIGFVAINLSRAGEGVRMPAGAAAQTLNAAPRTASELIVNIFPENIAKSVADGEVLQVVVFSVLFGLALAMVPEEKRRPLLRFAESLSETMFKFTNLVMLAAPIGVFGAIAYTVGHMGLGILLPLLRLLGTMYAALGVFVLLVLLPSRFWFACRYCRSSKRSPSRLPSRSPPPARKRRCRGPWKIWSRSASRGRRWPLCCPPATASTSTARACINRWR
jgi:proton glutamate symport protein